MYPWIWLEYIVICYSDSVYFCFLGLLFPCPEYNKHWIVFFLSLFEEIHDFVCIPEYDSMTL